MKKLLLSFSLSVVFFQTTFAFSNPQAQGSESPFWVQLIPLALVFAIFFFLLILPQQRKMKKHRAMVESLKKGDSVILSSGIHGKVNRLAEDRLTLYVEIADKVVVCVNKDSVVQVPTKLE